MGPSRRVSRKTVLPVKPYPVKLKKKTSFTWLLIYFCLELWNGFLAINSGLVCVNRRSQNLYRSSHIFSKIDILLILSSITSKWYNNTWKTWWRAFMCFRVCFHNYSSTYHNINKTIYEDLTKYTPTCEQRQTWSPRKIKKEKVKCSLAFSKR